MEIIDKLNNIIVKTNSLTKSITYKNNIIFATIKIKLNWITKRLIFWYY